MQKKKVCVIGLGYIGLPTAALLANRNYLVHGVDVQKDVVDTINKGKVHIVEPALDTFVRSAVFSGNLTAHTKPAKSDIFIIAVPTPVSANTEPDISYVISATKSIAPYLEDGNIIILESTSPIGTTEDICKILKKNNVNVDNLHIAYSPERVLPGQTMRELVENDRVVGGITEIAAKKVKEFYKTFVKGDVLTTNSRTAEMSKLTENSFRDVNIAFANELSIICDKFQIDVWELIKMANRHPRVNILRPGSGVGGHCIAVDPWFIVAKAKKDAKIIKQARLTNDYKPNWVIEKINMEYKKFQKKNNGKKPLISCMGIAFKPDIDDMRESPSLEIAKNLQKLYENILVVEPNIEKSSDFELINYKKAIEKADIIVFLVQHKEFKNLYISKEKVIIDICGIDKSF